LTPFTVRIVDIEKESFWDISNSDENELEQGNSGSIPGNTNPKKP